MSYAAENSPVFRCAMEVVMVSELFVTVDRKFQTAGAMILSLGLEVDPCRWLMV